MALKASSLIELLFYIYHNTTILGLKLQYVKSVHHNGNNCHNGILKAQLINFLGKICRCLLQFVDFNAKLYSIIPHVPVRFK